jgi:large subunit ribosomal protein L4
MTTAKIYQLEGGESEIEVHDEFVQGRIHRDLLFRAVQSYLMNRRPGTHAAKTRAQVAGSGRKVWPQKHTGRARHGDRRSPIWAGGGATFGPQPKEYEYKLPKKMRRAALASALRDRFQSDHVVLIDKLSFERPKTKEAIALLERLNIPLDETLLVIVTEEEHAVPVKKSFSNLPGVTLATATSVHPYDILRHTRLLITAGALQGLTRRVSLHGSPS